MTADLVQFASTAGELAENIWGRTDFEKYDSAWAKAQNWLVDYRGGLFTRPGTEFGDVIEWSFGEDVRLFQFQYTPDTANTYIIVFTDDKVRFIQDNAYVLEAEVTVDSVANGTGDKIVITATGHGYSDGDWVKLSGFTEATLLFLNGRTVEVTSKTTNTFDITDVISGSLITKASISTDAASVYRIYTVASPYGEEDLARLGMKRIRDYVRLTHPDYPVKNLIRNDTTDWEFANEDFSETPDAPTNGSTVITNTDNRTTIYFVTAVDNEGYEGPPLPFVINHGPAFSETFRSIFLHWDAVTGAVYYNVYRNRQTTSNATYLSAPPTTAGYIGQTTSLSFHETSPGITPDYTKTYPIQRNPFADATIQYVTVDTQGDLYFTGDAITWPAGGSGAIGLLLAPYQTAGDAVEGLKVLAQGSDYTATDVSSSDGDTNFAGTATLSESSGNNPRCCTVFQQRCIYAATENYPVRIFGSRSGILNNFNFSDIVADDDAYEFDLDVEAFAPIRHLVPGRGSLLAFSEIGVWLLYGRNNNALSGNNAMVDPQSEDGATYTPPINVDGTVIYVGASGNELKMLIYNDNINGYEGRNIALLANHLFKPSLEIDSMTYAKTPFKIAYATQANGRMLANTIDHTNGVYATTPLTTRGKFCCVTSVLEDFEDRVYIASQRKIGGNDVMFIERMAKRNFARIEDAWCVDGAIEKTRTYPDATLVPDTLTGAVTFTARNGTPFAAGDVGKVIRCGSGRATISSYTSNTEVDATWNKDLEDTYPETEDPAEFDSGDWTMDSTSTTLRGFWHMLGEEVTILADGVEVTKTVDATEGTITLDTAASRVIAGFGFTCTAKTLPPTVTDVPIEGRRKDIIGVAVRQFESSGLKMGNSLDKLYPIQDKNKARGWVSDDQLLSGIVYEPVRHSWDYDSGVFFVQDTPLPATILSFIRDIDVGDTKSDKG